MVMRSKSMSRWVKRGRSSSSMDDRGSTFIRVKRYTIRSSSMVRRESNSKWIKGCSTVG